MQTLSLLTIPEYNQTRFRHKCFGVSIDWKRFNIRSQSILEKIWWLSRRASNDTNNSTFFLDWLTFQRIRSPNWVAHNISFAFEGTDGVPVSIPVVHVEVYRKWQWLKWSVARVDFYWAYFHFCHVVPEILRWMYSTLSTIAENSGGDEVNVTRLDICVDIACKFPQQGYKLITPSKNTKRKVKSFMDPATNRWEGFSFDAQKNTNYGVRIYDKVVDIYAQWKDWWYENHPQNWTRIEFEFYSPYSNMNEDVIFENVTKRVLWEWRSGFEMKYRPTTWFKPITAYYWFRAYAKRHKIEIPDLLAAITEQHKIYTHEKEKFDKFIESDIV